MFIHQLNTFRTSLARGLMVYLLLMYLIWFPLHLQGHTSHSAIHDLKQIEGNVPNDSTPDDNAPLKDFCRLCEWWTLQDMAEALWQFDYVPFSVEHSYQLATYLIPNIEATAQLIPRAPPALV
ncbi:hypothetical protein OKW21_006270 [Catalinimonas alkaloidigena]|uniref:hypothetical protein n=1 Tax=Catalinimonas alkaloidigena TaxID=1075417 RepID=UPI0024054B8C|nr:hypothetical protein [Catalinimonas alkaloidigena]MDF9801007.1 hypothetical protein [Catalinimonas alkaloidigena]